MPDHVPLCPSIRPQSRVAYAIGFLKGKSAGRIPRGLLRERRMTGLRFWAAGYGVSRVGRDEARVRRTSASSRSGRTVKGSWTCSDQ
jgi:REP element-mobilizing transposase RayT